MANRRRKQTIRIALGFALSALFLYLAFRKVNLQEMASAFTKANYLYLLPATVFLILSLWFRAYRWGFFFKPIKNVRFGSLFSAMMIGYMANNVLPMRLGEFFRAYSIGRVEQISKVSSFATIVIERILDLLTLLILLALTLLLYPFPTWIQRSGYIIFGITSGSIIFLTFLVYKTEPTLGFMERIVRPFPEKLSEAVLKILRSLLEGFEVLRYRQYYAIIAVTSFLIWLSYAGIVQFTIMAFGFHKSYNLPILASIVVLVMAGIGVTIPSSPGYVGTYHYLTMQGLAIFGVDQSHALSFVIVLHLFSFLPITLGGLFYFWKENLTFAEALAEKELAEEQS